MLSGADSPVPGGPPPGGPEGMTPPARSLPALPGRTPSRRRRDRPADQPPGSDCSMRRGPGWAGASDHNARVADRRSWAAGRATARLLVLSPDTDPLGPAGDPKPVSAPPVPGSGSGGRATAWPSAFRSGGRTGRFRRGTMPVFGSVAPEERKRPGMRLSAFSAFAGCVPLGPPNAPNALMAPSVTLYPSAFQPLGDR